MKILTLVFGFLFASAAALACVSSVLTTLSLFIADRRPQSLEFLGISLFVSALFLVIGLLLAGIAWQTVALARIVRHGQRPVPEGLEARVRRLLILMIAAGVVVCSILALATFGILARIDESFAVFG